MFRSVCNKCPAGDATAHHEFGTIARAAAKISGVMCLRLGRAVLVGYNSTLLLQ